MLAKYLLTKKGFKYVLTRHSQSDCLEGRFGWDRLLAGADYYASVRQFLNAEKLVRIKSLIKFSNMNMLEIKEVFKEDNEAIRKQVQVDASAFLDGFEIQFRLGMNTLEDNAILFYVSGYIAKSIKKSPGQCPSCTELLVKDNTTLTVSIEEFENDENVERYKKRFFDVINRGGLCNPSDALFMVTVHAQEFFNKIFNDEETKSSFLKLKNPRAVFTKCFIETVLKCQNTASLGKIKCQKGHHFSGIMEIASRKIFNMGGKNFANDMNSKIHAARKNKRKTMTKDDTKSESVRKILKLTC